MSFFRRLRISVKLPLAMVALSALALVTMGVLAYSSARQILASQGQARLEGVLRSAQDQYAAHLDTRWTNLRLMSSSPQLRGAMTKLVGAWEALPGDRYATLQKRFVQDNPHPEGEKQMLDYTADRDGYTRAHRQYHPFFRTITEQYDHADFYLLNEEGQVLYSVMKRGELGADLRAGTFAETALGRMAARLMDHGEGVTPEGMLFADYAEYEGGRSGFMGAPILAGNGGLMGYIVVRLDQATLGESMGHTVASGSSGLVYSVGPDHVMRSIHGAVGETGPSHHGADSAVGRALAGEVGILATEHGGRQVLEAYRPFIFKGTRWAIVAQKAEDELFADAIALRGGMVVSGALLMLVIAAAGIVLSRNISRPLGRVGKAMTAISRGDYRAEVPDTGRGDEIGSIATNLQLLRDSLAEAEVVAVDSRFKGEAFDNSSAALMVVDGSGTVTYANRAMQALAATLADCGAPVAPARIVGSRAGRLLPDAAALDRALRAGAGGAGGAGPVFASLGERQLCLEVSPVLGEDGRHLGAVIEWSDVTESVRREAILEALDRQQAIIEFDLDGRVQEVNDNFCTLADRSRDQLAGQPITRVFRFDPEKERREGKVWSRVLRGDGVHACFEVPRPSEGQGWIDGGFALVLDRAGRPVKAVLIGNDVSRAQVTLRAAASRQSEMQAAQEAVVHSLQHNLRQLAQGDMTTAIETPFADEHDRLRLDFNEAVGSLLTAMRAVVQTSVEIETDSATISAASDDLSDRAEQQSDTLRGAAATINKLAESVRETAGGAAQTNSLVEGARSDTENSGAVVQQVVQAMGTIADSSTRISSIVEVIEAIAFQTNLLALNAGVEAARAGEAGRGFAVVATEVRALAQRSSQAASEINELISSSQSDVQRGVELVDQAGEALALIIASMGEITTHVSGIAEASRSQSAQLDEVNSMVASLDQVTQRNMGHFQQTNTASHSLREKAQTLNEVVGSFRIAPPSGAAGAAADAPEDPDAAARLAG